MISLMLLYRAAWFFLSDSQRATYDARALFRVSRKSAVLSMTLELNTRVCLWLAGTLRFLLFWISFRAMERSLKALTEASGVVIHKLDEGVDSAGIKPSKVLSIFEEALMSLPISFSFFRLSTRASR